jgi:uncharacterized protein (TIGR02231 family)
MHCKIENTHAAQARSAAALLLLLSALPAHAFSPDPAQPAEAFFYPDEARLSVTENLQIEILPSGATGFILVLPAEADPHSFTLRIDGVPAQSVYRPDEKEAESLLAPHGLSAAEHRASLPAKEQSPERRALLENLAALEKEKALAEGASAAAEARLALLRKSFDVYSLRAQARRNAPDFSPAGEAAALDAAYAERYPAVYAELETQRRALADVAPRLETARKELNDFDSLRKRRLYIVPFAPGEERHSLAYSYTLPAACVPSYSLDADPDKGEFVVNREATLTQNSGFTWNDADIHISTLRRYRPLDPPDLRTWSIVTADKAPPAPLPAARQQEAAPLRGNRSLAARREDARPAPAGTEQTEHGVFRVLYAGKKSLRNHTPLRLHLATDVYKADFLYTLRPSLTGRAFLTASLSLPESLELPPGPARFFVDGTPVGSRSFSFDSDKGVIFFGSDPQVNVAVRNLARSEGEQGLFSKDESFTRHWQFTVRNTRKRAADIVLEDPAPVSENEAVSIKTQSSPQPEILINPPETGGAKIFVWKARLESGGSLQIDHKVEARIAQDKDKVLIPGR